MLEDNENDLEDELYESISSQNTEMWGGVSRRKSSKVVEESSSQKQISKDVVFPRKPAQLDKLFKIYKTNSQKIKLLRTEVKTLDSTILEQMRLNNAQDHFDLGVQGIQQIASEQQSPIDKYKIKRKQRQNKLKQLNKLYDALNKLNQVQGFLLKEGNHQKMLEKIRQTKEITNYRVSSDHLVVVTKHKSVQSQLAKKQNQQANIYESGIFLQQQTDQSQHFTIAIFDLNNLKHWLSPKKAQFDIDEEHRAQNLQKCRKEAQMCINIGQKVIITTDQKIQTAIYSHKHQLIFIYNKHNQVNMFGLDGSQKLKIQLDEMEQIANIEIMNDNLVICTQEGVVRMYQVHVTENSEQKINIKGIRLTKVAICSWQGRRPSAYCLVGDENPKKMAFLCDRSICEYDLETNIISEISSVCQDYTDYISKNQKWQSFLLQSLLKKNLGKEFISKLSSSILDKKETEHLTHVYTSHLQQQEPKYQLLLADGQGTFRLVSL